MQIILDGKVKLKRLFFYFLFFALADLLRLLLATRTLCNRYWNGPCAMREWKYPVLIWLLNVVTDGISLYDPPEKIIPRWKVPPAEKNPVFLENFLEQRKALSVESLKNALPSHNSGKHVFHQSGEPSSQNTVRNVSGTSTSLQQGTSASSKTIIEGSDGSIKKGKKSVKEFWQHTKKWSQGFLDSYNSETDPEVKAVMRDIGKDLDRWITEKEIQEAATLMDKLPQQGREFIEQKLNKIKREMELFGPQAVVSKYREYAEEKEEDYLWWLDLPYLLVGILFLYFFYSNVMICIFLTIIHCKDHLCAAL